MSDSTFNSGLKAANDIYARRAGLVPPDEVENPVARNDEEIKTVDAAKAGLAEVEGAKPAKKAAAKKAAAKNMTPASK